MEVSTEKLGFDKDLDQGSTKAQWKLLNVIMDNVIIQLMWLDRPKLNKSQLTVDSVGDCLSLLPFG